jgi:hypothetical protein
MRRALDSQIQKDGTTLVEIQLLGALMLCPYLRLDCSTLHPQDFSDPAIGKAFSAVMAERYPELSLVVYRLELECSRPPHGYTGWGDALASVIGLAFVEDDAVPEAVRVIKESARLRRQEIRLRRPDASNAS